MISFNTNSAALGALDILRSTDSQRNNSLSRMQSGYRVATASDDAAYWSIATTMRSDNQTLAAVEDALGMASAVVDTAYNGFESATDLMAAFKQRLVLAREPGVDRDKINEELTVYKQELQTIAHASSFSGENWMWRTSTVDDRDRSLVGSFHRETSGEIKVTDVNYEIAGTAGTTDVNFLVDDLSGDSGILTGSGFAAALGTSRTWVMFNGENGPTYDEMTIGENTTDAEIEEMISVVDAMAERVTDVSSSVGALSRRVELQTSFVKDLQDSLTYGVGRMVDADLNEEATRFKALETQRKLGMESLSMINTTYIDFFELMSA